MSFQPLRITWQLGFPMVLGDMPLHLDGVLAWARASQAADDGIPFQEVIHDLPLAREERDGQWVWKASMIRVDRDAPTSHVVFRRQTDFVALHDMARETKAVTFRSRKPKAAGSYKNWQQQAPLVQARTAVAWCIGDRDGIHALLDRVDHLGKLARLGYGRVNGFRIEIDSEAEWRWQCRMLPWEHEGYVRTVGNARPPYWRRDLRQIVWMPLY